MTLAYLGIVVIGRNEGKRLRRCLRSAVGQGYAVAYVDSGSTDESVVFACSLGVEVVELDMATPFTAARARNAGFARLRELQPELRYVQFVDGDCELCPDWLAAGVDELARRPEVAAVCGRLRERCPETSVYNRLCDMEWDGPQGEVSACGGIAMFRVAGLLEVGGFDPTIPAGEEPELCMRLRARGWRIVRLAKEMALHDARMTRFMQWWRRAVRYGYGSLDTALRFGHQDSARQVRSARLWVGSTLAILAAGIVGEFMSPRAHYAIVAAVCVVAAYLLQIVRIARKERSRSISAGMAFWYAVFMMLGKWAQVAGHLRYAGIRRCQGRSVMDGHKDGSWRLRAQS